MSSSFSLVQQIKTAVTIEDIFRQEFPSANLQQRGHRLWACCPFHGERTASFFLDVAGQRYHCFGCHADGDVIDLIALSRNISTRKAVKLLAIQHGISSAPATLKQRQEIQRQQQERERQQQEAAAMQAYILRQQDFFRRLERALLVPDADGGGFSTKWRDTFSAWGDILFGADQQAKAAVAALLEDWSERHALDIAFLLGEFE